MFPPRFINACNIEELSVRSHVNIFPKQIIADFEYSENEYIDQKKFSEWENKLMSLINKLKRNHYKCYYLPRYSHIPYSTIEVLFVNTDNY